MLDKTFALLIFALMCVMCIVYVLVLSIVTFAWRRGAVIASRMMVFYILTLVGVILSALAQYWHAFGPPPGHSALPDIVQMCSLCVYGMAFWIARRPLGQNMSRFVQANGGTACSALVNFLLHPNLSLSHLRSQMPVADTELPPV